MAETSDTPYVTQLEIAGFGCIDTLDLKLTRIHAFVGPNDSGKSTILRAAARVLQQLNRVTSSAELTAPIPSYPAPAVRAQWLGGTTAVHHRVKHAWDIGRSGSPAELAETTRLASAGPLAMSVRLDPDAMRRASPPIASNAPIDLGARGEGLASVLSALLEQERDTFDTIEQRLIALFPHVAKIRLRTEAGGQKGLGFRLTSNVDITADDASEGLLYTLAFITLTAWRRPLVLLVEEPENGLHPARIAEVVKMLRAVSHETQVLMATHSPLVLNELEGDEISIVTRPAGGATQVARLCDTPHYAERSKVYQNGELWLSYGDATDERALLHGEPRPGVDPR